MSGEMKKLSSALIEGMTRTMGASLWYDASRLGSKSKVYLKTRELVTGDRGVLLLYPDLMYNKTLLKRGFIDE